MNFIILFILLVYSLIKATTNHHESNFLRYNLEGLKQDNDRNYCPNPEFFIKAADIEENKPSNHDKIILYHGETYGAWIYQMIIKAFLYPEAPEDWLPLRLEPLNSDIDKTALLRLIKTNSNDHHSNYLQFGMSVTPNLYSESVVESAWGPICKKENMQWHKISGFSDYFGNMHHRLYAKLREKLIPNDKWAKFKIQKKLLNYFIQERRLLYRVYVLTNFKDRIRTFFPETFRRYPEEFDSFPEQIILKRKSKSEGVALQIIMDKKLADQIVYNSHPFGWLKDDEKYSKYKSAFEGNAWEEDEILPYSEVYQKVKNQKDFEQARLALTNDFRQFPSRVRIKAIVGIMENPVDNEIVQSMIQEMVSFDRPNEVEKKEVKQKVEDKNEQEFREKKKISGFAKLKKKIKDFF